MIPRGFACRSLVWLGRKVVAGVVQRADLPQGNARQLDGNGGMRVAWAWRLHKTYKIMMGAPVFALTGYAVASHVIPRGFAGRSVVGRGQ